MPKRLTRAIALCVSTLPLLSSVAHAEGGLGAYLAARQANFDRDFLASAEYFERALENAPDNLGMLDSTVYTYVSLGAFEAAIPHAQRLRELEINSQVGNLAFLVNDAKNDAWDDVLADLSDGQEISPLIDEIARAWAIFGQGQVTEALAAFDAAAQSAGMTHFALYNKALALASVGDFEGADALLSEDSNKSIQQTRRGTIAHSQILSQLGRNQDALDLLNQAFGGEFDASVQSLVDALASGERVPYSLASGPREGLAELLFTAASVMAGEADPTYTILFARGATALYPNHIEALMLTGNLYEGMGLYDLANDTYALVPQDDPAFVDAELARADALQRADRLEAATEVLQSLARNYPDLAAAHASLGDVLRRRDLMREAKPAYERALELYAQDNIRWYTHYMLGIVNHDLDLWPEAEAHFRAALEIVPTHPSILNYLGYSLVERGEKLDEALEMIITAVQIEPENGAIVDSLGWVQFQLGKYEDAIVQMERAAELEPVDPIVNDHLGDALWAVGRKNEASFQWKRALSFGPTEEDAARIRRKLEVGLDKVREEEGAAPLFPSVD